MGKKGKLLFKGDTPKKDKKKVKHSLFKNSQTTTTTTADATKTATTTSIPVLNRPSTSTSSSTPLPKIQQGTGRITTSGTVVTGIETRFEKEIQPGDAIMVVFPNDGSQELRVVTMRLSNISLNLSSPFTINIKHPTKFSYIPKPKDKAKERQLAAQQHALAHQEQQKNAFDLYTNETLVYREKTETGSYRIKREPINSGSTVVDSGGSAIRSRGDLLELRAKKTSDKYC